MKINITQYVLEKLENNGNHEWKILPSKPSDIDHHSVLIAIDPTQTLLTDDLKLTSAVIVGIYKNTHKIIDMLQNDNLQIGYLSVKDKDKTRCYENLYRAIRKILVDFYEDSQQTICS